MFVMNVNMVPIMLLLIIPVSFHIVLLILNGIKTLKNVFVIHHILLFKLMLLVFNLVFVMILQSQCMLLNHYHYLFNLPLNSLVLTHLMLMIGVTGVLVSVLKEQLLRIVNVLLLVLKFKHNLGINGVIVHME